MRKLKLISFLALLMLSLTGCDNAIGTINDSFNDTIEDILASFSGVETELQIDAPPSLQNALEEIQSLYSAENNSVKLNFTFNNSTDLSSILEEGSNCDFIISSSRKALDELKDKGQIAQDTRKDLVSNSLMLIAPPNSTLTKLSQLSNSDISAIAIGEPTIMPSGKYAIEALTNLKLMNSLESKLVYGIDTQQVLNYITDKQAQAAIVYKTDAVNAVNNGTAKMIEELPTNSYSPILYQMVVTESSLSKAKAEEFEDFLLSNQAQEVFRKYGFTSVSTNNQE